MKRLACLAERERRTSLRSKLPKARPMEMMAVPFMSRRNTCLCCAVGSRQGDMVVDEMDVVWRGAIRFIVMRFCGSVRARAEVEKRVSNVFTEKRGHGDAQLKRFLTWHYLVALVSSSIPCSAMISSKKQNPPYEERKKKQSVRLLFAGWLTDTSTRSFYRSFEQPFASSHR